MRITALAGAIALAGWNVCAPAATYVVDVTMTPKVYSVFKTPVRTFFTLAQPLTLQTGDVLDLTVHFPTTLSTRFFPNIMFGLTTNSVVDVTTRINNGDANFINYSGPAVTNFGTYTTGDLSETFLLVPAYPFDQPPTPTTVDGVHAKATITGLTVPSTATPFGPVTFDTAYLSVATVPEPATWGLMLFGFGAVGAGVRRSRSLRTPRAAVRA